MRLVRPQVLATLVLLVLAATVWTGCAGAADQRRSGSTLTFAGPATCTPPATPRPLGANPAAADGLLVGLSASLRFFSGTGLCKASRATYETGARVVREDFAWDVIEPRRGVYDWTVPDRMVANAGRWGFVLLPILGVTTPVWARATRARSFARYAAAVVRRYGPSGTFARAHPELALAAPIWFELWNEPYERTNPNRLSVRAYANLVRAGVPAARAANANAKFLVSAAASYKREDGSFGDWTTELNALAPLTRFADGASVHAYGLGPPRPFDPSSSSDQVSSVEGVRADLVRLGAGTLPVWVTETGWSTCSNRSVCVSEKQQAAYLDELFRVARTRWRTYVRALIVYDLQDSPRSLYRGKEGFFGLSRVGGTAKPARAVFVRRAGRR